MSYEFLIEEVRKRPAIYDKSNPNYKERKTQFHEIANKMNDVWGTSFSASNIQGTWTNLEKEFQQIYEKIKHAPSGSSADVSTTSFPYFNQMQFLKESSEHRPSNSSISKADISIWKKTNKTLEGKKKENVKKSTPTMPELDKFAQANMQKNQNVHALMADVKDIMKNKTQEMLDLFEQNSKNSDDLHYSLIFEKLNNVKEEKLDECFIKILQSLKQLRQL